MIGTFAQYMPPTFYFYFYTKLNIQHFIGWFSENNKKSKISHFCYNIKCWNDRITIISNTCNPSFLQNCVILQNMQVYRYGISNTINLAHNNSQLTRSILTVTWMKMFIIQKCRYIYNGVFIAFMQYLYQRHDNLIS